MSKRPMSGRVRIGKQTDAPSRSRKRSVAPELRQDLDPLMYHATSLQACGKNDEAAEAYGRVLEQQPDHWLAINNLGVVMDMAGDPGAEDMFRRVIRLSPSYAEGWNNLGRCLQNQGRQGDAREAYKQALKLKPDHAGASSALQQLASGMQSSVGVDDKGAKNLLARIAAMQRQGRASDALTLLDECRGSIPLEDWNVHRGQLLVNQCQWDAAAEAFRSALKIDENRWEALRGLAHALAQGGHLDESSALARNEERKGRRYQALMLDGLALVERGQHSAAIAYFDSAAQVSPAEIDGHFYAGVCALSAGDNARAESAFRAVLTINPQHGPSLNNLGNALLNQGRLADAVGVLEKARKSYPDDVVLLNTLGLTLTRLDRFDEAEPVLRAAVTINKNFVEGWSNLAKVKLDTSDPRGAVRLLEHALDVRPDFHLARYNLGLSLFQLGRIEEAITNLEETIRLDPGFAPAHHNLGMLCLMHGRYEQGWYHYQWRDSRQTMENARKGWQPHTPPLPDDLEGKWISLTGEQGIGDELFFLRFVPELKARGARIVYRPNIRKLKFLFDQMPFLDQVLEPSQVVEEGAAYEGLIGDLPYLLGMKQAREAPPPVPIHAAPAKAAGFYLNWLQDLPPPYIGVCWRAGTQHSRQDTDYNETYQKLNKQLTLDALIETLKGIPATFVILQRNPLPGEITRFSEGVGCPVLDCSDLNDDLPEMVAALACLDDMVGVSNTNYHLRAGLGLHGRTLVPKHPEFRWLDHGDASPWFPGFKVYREDMELGWLPALKALREDLLVSISTTRNQVAGLAPENTSAIAMPLVQTFSRQHPSQRYRDLQTLYRRMHEEGEQFIGLAPAQVFPGQSLPPQAGRIKRLIDLTGARTLLDYGSGKGMQYQPSRFLSPDGRAFESIVEYWDISSVRCYDPAYEPFIELPNERFDGVISTDVLEHCPEEDIPWIIDEIFSYGTRFVFANVACYPAKKRLANGENAHCTIKPPQWWEAIIQTTALRHTGLVWEFWVQYREGGQNGAPFIEKRLGSD